MNKTSVLCFKCVSLAAVLTFLGVNLHAMGQVFFGGAFLTLASAFIAAAVGIVSADILKGDWK